MKSYYTSYALHCIRLYIRIPREDLRTDVDRLNYDSVERVLLRHSQKEQDLITYCLRNYKHDMSDTVRKYAELTGMDAMHVSAIISNIVKEVAKERKLI